MTTVLVFAYAVWCTPALPTGNFLARASAVSVERSVVVRDRMGRERSAACRLRWGGYHAALLDWCTAVGDAVCWGTVEGVE